MKLIISALLISAPAILTTMIVILQVVAICSKRISIELFFKIRTKLAKTRWISNLIAIIVLLSIELYDIAIIYAFLMLITAGIDVIFYYLKKILNENKG